jgi:hypothetical protein
MCPARDEGDVGAAMGKRRSKSASDAACADDCYTH